VAVTYTATNDALVARTRPSTLSTSAPNGASRAAPATAIIASARPGRSSAAGAEPSAASAPASLVAAAT